MPHSPDPPEDQDSLVTQSHEPNEVEPAPASLPRDADHWSKPVTRLEVGEVPASAININVTGRRVMGPVQGFGKMWQKTYRIGLGHQAEPREVIQEWKTNFSLFWPEGANFYGPITGIAPGEVALLNLSMPGKLKLSTGVLVLFADDDAFTLMTPQGHMFAAWITFTALEDEGQTVAQTQVLLRANDPLYELALGMGGHKKEDAFWTHTLHSLAEHFGVDGAEVSTKIVCIDKKRQWSKAKNIWHNSAIRSGGYMMGTPFRAIARSFRSPRK